jgi:hypothetical protein
MAQYNDIVGLALALTVSADREKQKDQQVWPDAAIAARRIAADESNLSSRCR